MPNDPSAPPSRTDAAMHEAGPPNDASISPTYSRDDDSEHATLIDPATQDPAESAMQQAGTHPFGVTLGAIGGAVAGAVVGIAAGPVGSLAGAVGGAVAGGLLGSGIGSVPVSGPVTPTGQDTAAGDGDSAATTQGDGTPGSQTSGTLREP